MVLDPLDIKIIYRGSGGHLEKNILIGDYFKVNPSFRVLSEYSRRGTPIVALGEGRPRVMITAGVHGNEIPPQLASLELIKFLAPLDIMGTVYIIPFAAPWSTMNNTRWFKGVDLNRSSHAPGSVTNTIFKVAVDLGVDALGDFHSTAPRSNPGRESIFCSKKPCRRSYLMAKYISRMGSSDVIAYETAASHYKGALEDECNLGGVGAVTCEVVSENGSLAPGSLERSLLQMKAFLKYFNVI
ncbi:MAG TPA: deacylase [Methanothermobacter sp.]|jgi:predicted deacylase|uniref:Deacylase n=2 Tax=Methanothermobacter tenebrarum TaxID=680118 RepID=A0ABN6P9B2_9EURY|nr:deacylase [Methanothermobacter tenebrarum]HHW17005.1 deacylase [Methanothermobacter sp.]